MDQLIDSMNKILNQYPTLVTVIYSVFLTLIFIVLRSFLHKNLKPQQEDFIESIHFKKRLNTSIFYFYLLCLFILWFTQLQVFLVSILAIAAAIVIALKELIMCMTGGILIKSAQLFKVGHRIEINEQRGFVIEKNLLSTKILEIGPDKHSQQTTGNIITIPNSLMLAHPIKNESYFKGYSIKSFVYKIDDTKKIRRFEKDLLERAKLFCIDYIDDAQKLISEHGYKEGIVVPSVEPKTKVIIENGAEISVLVKLPVLNSEVADLEQALNRFYLDWLLNS